LFSPAAVLRGPSLASWHYAGLFVLFNVVRNELLDEDFDLATFYDSFIRPLLAASPFIDTGFSYSGFVEPLSRWPVTNFGDLTGLPDPSLNKMAVFSSPVLLISGTADPFHTITSSQKALGDLITYSVNSSLSAKSAPPPSVPVYPISVKNAGSFVFFFTSYCVYQFLSAPSTKPDDSCKSDVPINWNFGSGHFRKYSLSASCLANASSLSFAVLLLVPVHVL
jgi:hypothetical protein